MSKIEQKIPEGWSVKKLGEISQVITGSTPQTLDVTNYGKEFLFVSPADINDNVKYITDTTTKLSSKGFSLCRIIKKGSPMFVCIGSTIGKTALAGIDLATNQQINSCIVKNCINNEFLYYNLSFQSNKIRLLAGEQAVPIINKSTFEKIKLSIPPLAEQEKIAEILGTWDEAIEKLSSLIEQKKFLKKGLMQKLFLDLKNVSFKRFDEVFTDYSDKNHSDYPLLSATQDLGVIPRTMLDGRVMSPEGSLAGYKLVQKGDFVISLRSFQGGLEYSSYYGIISPAYTVLKPKMNISRQFYKYFFKSYEFVNKYLSIAVIGIRDGKQISYPDLKSVKIPYPNLFNQQAIADVLTKADEEIDLLNKKLILFKEQKKGLMQQLLTGQIRVKVN
mgnify:CR=1 FL=1